MTFIFIGRSGSGKGTQAELLINHLRGLNSTPTVYLETGRYVREFINRSTHSGRLAKAVSESGSRQPDFLAIYLWSDWLINNLAGDENIVFDGTPRSLVEAQALDTALTFYQRVKPQVIFLDVAPDRARDRLKERGRHDDDNAGIEKRLSWYENDVAPVLDYYRQNPKYLFTQINGHQTIEAINNEIVKLCVAT